MLFVASFVATTEVAAEAMCIVCLFASLSVCVTEMIMVKASLSQL